MSIRFYSTTIALALIGVHALPVGAGQANESPEKALARLGAISGEAALVLRPREEGEVAELQRANPLTFVIIGEDWTGGIEGLKHLKELRDLRGVQFSHPDFSDEWCAVLEDMPQLTELYVQGENFTDDGMKHLERLRNLEALSFVMSKVTDDGLAVLKNMPEVRWLSLAMCREVTNAGLKHVEHLTELTYLNLNVTDTTADGNRHLKNATKMEDLRLSGTVTQGPPGFKHLMHMKRLRQLSIGDMWWHEEEEEMTRLVTENPELRIVTTSDGTYTKEGWKQQKRYEGLIRLATVIMRAELAKVEVPIITGRIDGHRIRLPKDLHKVIVESTIGRLSECSEVKIFLADEWNETRKKKPHLQFVFFNENAEGSDPVRMLVLLSDERIPTEIWIHSDELSVRFKTCGENQNDQWKQWLSKAERVL